MANQPPKPELSENVRSLLAALRLRVKLYVWFEGLAVAILWLVLSFWFTYLIDYWVLVRGFAVELSWQFRAILLLGTAGVLGGILYRWILRRAFARLADHSMAVVLERRFGEFRDSLVTSVEMSERPDHAEEFNREMLSRTSDEALAHTGNVRLRDVFNFVPLFLSGTTAVVLIGSVALFAVFGTDMFLHATSRIYLLSDEPWDRVAEIEFIGVHVEVPESLVETTEVVDELAFDDGSIRVARGSNLTLKVRADAGKTIPHKCVVKYWLDDGEFGKVDMEKFGKPKDGYQEYHLDRQPFKGVSTGFRFEVIGKRYGTLGAGDDEDSDDEAPRFSLGLWPVSNRLEGYVEVVESPIVAETTIHYTRPGYIDPSQTPRTVDYRSGTKVEVGSNVTLQCRANKTLKYAHVFDPTTEVTTKISIDETSDEFTFTVDQLNDDLTLEITLHDSDDIVSETPYRLHIVASPDEPPKVDTFLRGIGSAVTPDVVIPFRGTVTDDHGLAKTWIEAHAPEMDSFDEAVQVARDGEVSTAIDFQKRRDESEDKEANRLKIGDGNRLTIVVKSEDHRDLGEGPNLGFGQQHELDIVTPDRLMVILEQLETGQRERMEQIHTEMNQAHGFLLKVRASGQGKSLLDEPGKTGDESDDDEEKARKEHEIRLIFAQRALLQTRKSAHEINGVIATIRDIREQMINNRLEADEHKRRLKEQIADPLQAVADDAFPGLEQRLVELEKKLKELGLDLEGATAKEDANATTAEAIKQAKALLMELEEVLKMLRKLEDYNRLLGYIRELIKEEEELLKKTKQKYEADAFGELLE